MAFYEGRGYCSLKNIETGKIREFSNKFELDGIEFMEPNVHFFSFNNPYGACPECEGYGKVIGIDEDLVIPNKNLSLFEDAVASWKGESMSEWKKDFIKKCRELVKQYALEHLDESDNIPEFDVFVAWNVKVLQNNKALLSTTLFDGMYYEITYNGDKQEFYFDAYKKFENKCIKV